MTPDAPGVPDSPEVQDDRCDSDGPPGWLLVRLVAPLVPPACRSEWLAEWRGELAWARHAAHRRGDPALLTHLHLLGRALGAASDALWLRRRHGVFPVLDLGLRYALRALRRRPAFSVVVILTLAIGIGATTAIFSVVNGVLLRPLPFPAPDRLVLLSGRATDGQAEKVSPGMSYPDFMDLRAQTHAFAQLAAWTSAEVTLGVTGREPARVQAHVATPNLLRTLGAAPARGRDLGDADADPAAPAAAVVSHAFWQRRLGGAVDAVGRTLRVDGVPTQIVGVLPADLRLFAGTELWLPPRLAERDAARGRHQLSVVGRLRPAVTLAEARADADAVARRLALAYPEDNAHRAIARGRIARQWLVESLLLALAGGTMALGVAWLGMHALLAWASRTIPRADEVALDAPVLGFLLAVSLAVGLFFGVLPALQRRGIAPAMTLLRDGGRTGHGGAAGRRLRQTLVAAEMAVATVLVVGAVLLLGSFWRLVSAPPGFAPDDLAVMHLQLPPATYDSPVRILGFYDRLREEVAGVPGVRDVAVAYEHPLSEGWTTSYAIDDEPPPPLGSEPEARMRAVSPAYFRTAGIPLLRGRDVAATDRFGAPGAAWAVRRSRPCTFRTRSFRWPTCGSSSGRHPARSQRSRRSCASASGASTPNYLSSRSRQCAM